MRTLSDSFFVARFTPVAQFVGLIWAVFLIDACLPFLHLSSFGIHPRTLPGLAEILTAPFLHANLAHIVANTSGLLFLGWLCAWPTPATFYLATLGSLVGSGIAAWALGAPHSVHLGASGLVFGYAGFLMSRGIYARSIPSALTGLLVAFSYGLSMLWGILPLTPGVSWQCHAGGLVGGALSAKWLSSRK